MIALALDGDRAMLRLCLAHLAPRRGEASDWLGLSLAEDKDELRSLVNAVTEAAEKGARSPRRTQTRWFASSTR